MQIRYVHCTDPHGKTIAIHSKASFCTSQHPAPGTRSKINLKTAKALGLEVPAGLLVRADEVIE